MPFTLHQSMLRTLGFHHKPRVRRGGQKCPSIEQLEGRRLLTTPHEIVVEFVDVGVEAEQSEGELSQSVEAKHAIHSQAQSVQPRDLIGIGPLPFPHPRPITADYAFGMSSSAIDPPAEHARGDLVAVPQSGAQHDYAMGMSSSARVGSELNARLQQSDIGRDSTNSVGHVGIAPLPTPHPRPVDRVEHAAGMGWSAVDSLNR